MLEEKKERFRKVIKRMVKRRLKRNMIDLVKSPVFWLPVMGAAILMINIIGIVWTIVAASFAYIGQIWLAYTFCKIITSVEEYLFYKEAELF